MARIALRVETLDRRRRELGLELDKDLADRIGVHATQVARVARGDSAPGTRFIAGLVALFGPGSFDELFDVLPDDS